MSNITQLYSFINWSAIPSIIKDEFCKYGNIKSSVSTRNETGKMDTIYGNNIPPYYTKFKNENYEYYCIEKYYEDLIKFAKSGFLFDFDDNQISVIELNNYLLEYAKGFNDGYQNYEETIKPKNSLFSSNDIEIAQLIFSRISGSLNRRTGNFKLLGEIDQDKNRLLKEKYNIKIVFKASKENFYQSGIDGGEFYKAWEIILRNPILFKPIFEANIKLKEDIKTEDGMIKIENGISITIFEKIKRELNLIHWIFKSQFEKKSTNLLLPLIHNDGRYCNIIYIRTEIELLRIEEYKKYYYERFEKTKNPTLINNELLSLLEKLNFLVKFYEENLTINNKVVAEVISDLKKKYFENEKEHKAVVLVENIEPQNIFFGYNEMSYNNELDWTKRKYNYASNNFELCKFCLKLIEFINSFNIESNQTKTVNRNSSNQKKYFFNITTKQAVIKADSLAEKLIAINQIEKKSKALFINAFTGKEPKEKINWIGKFGNLQTLIKHSSKVGFIKNERNKWEITSNIFSNNDIEFDKDTIRNTKKTTEENNIIDIIKNLNF